MLMYSLLENEEFDKLVIDVENQKVLQNKKQILPFFVLRDTKIIIGKKYKMNLMLPEVVLKHLNITSYNCFVRFLIHKYTVIAEETIEIKTNSPIIRNKDVATTQRFRHFTLSTIKNLVKENGEFDTEQALFLLMNLNVNKPFEADYTFVHKGNVEKYLSVMNNDEIEDKYEDVLYDISYNTVDLNKKQSFHELNLIEENHYVKMIYSSTYRKSEVHLIYETLFDANGIEEGIRYKVSELLKSSKENTTKCIYANKEIERTKIINKHQNIKLCKDFPTLSYFTERINPDMGCIEVIIYDDNDVVLVSSYSFHSELAYYFIQHLIN